MKHLLVPCAVAALAAATVSNAQDLVVHEWGTFTTVQGSDCELLPGLYLEEEHLPPFVYHHDGFSPDAVVTAKGVYKPITDAMVKMETPVLYFYSGTERKVSVDVKFTGGTISQWYPQRSDGEVMDDSPILDLSRPYSGWIRWNTTILPPDSKTPLSPPKDQETPTWTAPRATDANLVRNDKGETEAFLFYRGVGNFKVPLSACFGPDGTLNVTNNGSERIPYLFIYNKPEGKQEGEIWWTGALEPGQGMATERTAGKRGAEAIDAGFREFEDALVAAGLYRKEAAAMLNTWWESYFGHPGLKVFWIVPRSMTDMILPITLSPAPDSLERVLVGRSEVLFPEFEQQLLADYKAGNFRKWEQDRYYLAYNERARRMQEATTSDAPNGTIGSSDKTLLSISPNPAGGVYELSAEPGEKMAVTITVTDGVGSTVLKLDDRSMGTTYRRQIDMSDFPAGSYFITLTAGDRRWTGRIVNR